MNGFQQGTLPANPQQQQYQTVFVDFNNPPPFPQYQCSQELYPWLPTIATMVVLEIQNNMSRNALRMFMFNHYVQNNFNNQHFFRLVTNLADWMEMEMSLGNFNDPNACLQKIVPIMVEMTTCMQLANYPDLAQFIDQQLFHHAQSAAQRFNNLGGQIANWQAQRSQQQQRQAPQQSGGSWAQSQMGGGSAGGFANAWGSQHNTFGQPPQIQTQHAGGANPLFNENPRPTQQGYQPPQEAGGGRYAHRRQASYAREVGGRNTDLGGNGVETVQYREPTRDTWSTQPLPDNHPLQEPVQAATPVAAPAQSDQGQMLLADESGLTWRPSLTQPYPLAYNPRTHLLYHRKTATGEVVEVLRARSTESMDYEKHRLPQGFGPSARAVNVQEAQSKLARMAQTLAEPNDLEDPTLDPEKAALLRNRVVDTPCVLENGLEEAWVVCQLGRLAAAHSGKAPDIYHRRAKVAKTILDTTDQSPYIQDLAECGTFTEVRMKLLGLGSEMNQELWQLCERKLTDAVNHVLVSQLSISTLKIESFLEDIEDLVDVLAKRYGDLISEAFLQSASRVIRTSFALFEEEYSDHEGLLSENFMLEYSSRLTTPPVFTHLVSNVTITILSCTAQELELEVGRNHAALITSTVPFLQALAKDIYYEVPEAVRVADGLDEPTEYEHHYIRTADGRVLELTHGLLGDDSFMLRLIQ